MGYVGCCEYIRFDDGKMGPGNDTAGFGEFFNNNRCEYALDLVRTSSIRLYFLFCSYHIPFLHFFFIAIRTML